MVACVPAVPNAYHIEEELDPNTFSQRRSQLVKTPPVAREAPSCSQCMTQDPVANTTLTTQAEIHHQYSNDDSPGHSGDTEEGQDHQYASVAPPPLPVCDDEHNSSPGATGPYPLQAAHSWDSEEGQDYLYASEDNLSPEATVPYPLQPESGHPNSQIDEIVSDEKKKRRTEWQQKIKCMKTQT
ncbi:hypothetical protein Bbelb_040110 [Branchiostoma belcheri]|nr:hypothetical protein Bbelb_040110 [Branchiostoma belcheri]